MPEGVPVNGINETFSAREVIMHFPLSLRNESMNRTPQFHRGPSNACKVHETPVLPVC